MEDVRVIPEGAEELVVETWPGGSRRAASYAVGGEEVGRRWWSEDGELEMEYGVRGGLMHGPFRTWHAGGALCEESSYVGGLEHGVARQYDEAGQLVGTYAMEMGTGVDLWFERAGVLAEERHMLGGQRHGFERWWRGDNATVVSEGHYWRGEEHGVFREWGPAGRLRRGSPRYAVAGRRVTRRQYLRARQEDPTLPPALREEDSPERELPEALRGGPPLS